jgi:2,4-dienoyl-CoA reductase (NADPH2)
MVAGATYDRIDDDGLHYQAHGEKHVLAVDNVILCTGQEPDRALYDELRARGVDST